MAAKGLAVEAAVPCQVDAKVLGVVATAAAAMVRVAVAKARVAVVRVVAAEAKVTVAAVKSEASAVGGPRGN